MESGIGLIIEGLNSARSCVEKSITIDEESSDIKFSDVSDFRTFKKDKDNAVVLFKYNGKNYMQGYDGGKEVNLEFTDDGIEGILDVLKDQGFSEVNVSKDDIQKQYDNILNESYIYEKIGDRKSAVKKESGSTSDVNDRAASKKANKAVSIGTAAGGAAIGTAATGALVKAVAVKFGMKAAMMTAGKGLAKVAIVKIATAVPMATFGGLALAGVGCAVAGVVVAKKILNKRKKEKEEANSDYKTAWGKYYKRDGNEWVQIDKETYYKENPKNESYIGGMNMSNVNAILEGLNDSRERYVTIAGVRTKVDDEGNIIDEKAKKVIGERLGNSFKDKSEDDEVQANEGQWKTMRGNHILVDDKGDIVAGGPESMRKKISAKELKKEVEDANSKSTKKGKKSLDEINSMSRDERIQYGKDICMRITGKKKIVDNNAGLLYWAKGTNGEEAKIIDDAFGKEDSIERHKFWKDYDAARAKYSDAEKKSLVYMKKLNSGEEMSSKDLEDLEKCIKNEENEWKKLNSVLDKYGVKPKKYKIR